MPLPAPVINTTRSRSRKGLGSFIALSQHLGEGEVRVIRGEAGVGMWAVLHVPRRLRHVA